MSIDEHCYCFSLEQLSEIIDSYLSLCPIFESLKGILLEQTHCIRLKSGQFLYPLSVCIDALNRKQIYQGLPRGIIFNSLFTTTNISIVIETLQLMAKVMAVKVQIGRLAANNNQKPSFKFYHELVTTKNTQLIQERLKQTKCQIQEVPKCTQCVNYLLALVSNESLAEVSRLQPDALNTIKTIKAAINHLILYLLEKNVTVLPKNLDVINKILKPIDKTIDQSVWDDMVQDTPLAKATKIATPRLNKSKRGSKADIEAEPKAATITIDKLLPVIAVSNIELIYFRQQAVFTPGKPKMTQALDYQNDLQLSLGQFKENSQLRQSRQSFGNESKLKNPLSGKSIVTYNNILLNEEVTRLQIAQLVADGSLVIASSYHETFNLQSPCMNQMETQKNVSLISNNKNRCKFVSTSCMSTPMTLSNGLNYPSTFIPCSSQTRLAKNTAQQNLNSVMDIYRSELKQSRELTGNNNKLSKTSKFR